MKLIKRFDLQIEPSQKIAVPFNAEIIKFALFGGIPCFWAIVDSEGRSIERTILIVSDNKEIAQSINRTKYIGSFRHEAAADTMLHVFEE